MTTAPLATRRIARGIFANLFTFATRVTVQFATLPLFFANWTSDRIGSWMILFAIPAYIASVGHSFAGAGGNAALAAAQAGDMDRARGDFRMAWALSATGTAALALIFLGLGELLLDWLAGELAGIAPGEFRGTFRWLALYLFAVSQMSVLDAAFRVAGRYPDHIVINAFAQLAEILVIAVCVTISESLAVLAMGLALMRLGFAMLNLVLAWRAAPALFSRGATPLRQSLAELWKPSLAFMTVPLILALNLQGYLLLVGTRYGPTLLAGFVATRTLTRLLDLLTSFSYGVQYYEAGYLGADRRDIQRRQLATMTTLTALIVLGFSAVLLAAGPALQSLYTLGQTAFDPAVAAVLLLAAGIRAIAASPMAMVASENRHSRIVLYYLAGSAFSLALAAGLSFSGASLPIVLSGLILAELAQAIPVFRTLLRQLGLPFGKFLRLLYSPKRLADIGSLSRRLLRGS